MQLVVESKYLYMFYYNTVVGEGAGTSSNTMGVSRPRPKLRWFCLRCLRYRGVPQGRAERPRILPIVPRKDANGT